MGVPSKVTQSSISTAPGNNPVPSGEKVEAAGQTSPTGNRGKVLRITLNNRKLINTLNQLGIEIGGDSKNKIRPSAFEKAGVLPALFHAFANIRFRSAKLDRLETTLLLEGLKSLDRGLGKLVDGQYHFHDVNEVRKRINIVSHDRCWLDSLEFTLLGQMTGARGNYLSFSTYPYQPLSKPNIFECDFKPELVDQTLGLFFNVDQAPPKVAEAAKSVLRIDINKALRGPMVAYHSPGYFLTAAHLFDQEVMVEKSNGKKYISLSVFPEGKITSYLAEVIEPDSSASDLDLKILYIPELSHVPYLNSVPSNEKPPSPRFDATVKGSRIAALEVTRPDILIFVMGFASPPFHNQLLLAAGNTLGYIENKSLAITNAITLFGFSGGPVLNHEGELLGILLEGVYDQGYLQLGHKRKKRCYAGRKEYRILLYGYHNPKSKFTNRIS